MIPHRIEYQHRGFDVIIEFREYIKARDLYKTIICLKHDITPAFMHVLEVSRLYFLASTKPNESQPEIPQQYLNYLVNNVIEIRESKLNELL